MWTCLLVAAATASAFTPVSASTVQRRATLDVTALGQKYFGNDSPWYKDRIPWFEIADSKIQDVYYYRWKIFRAHQRDLGQRGYISTEFMDDVSWQLEPWASLNDATGFHLNEGRWNRDRRFAQDYLNHMYEGGGNNRHFTDYMADAAYEVYKLDGSQADLTKRLDKMISLYNSWQNDHYDTSKGLFYVSPLLDATEYTIASIDASCGNDGFSGGVAFRPSVNSYQWANALAIANTATLVGRNDVATDFRNRASALKSKFQGSIWNSTLSHFIDRHQTNTNCVKYWGPIRGRELVGFVPWMFSMPDDTAVFNSAWKHLIDPNRLAGQYGMRTTEPSYQYYMRQYRYEGSSPECQWNGPVWPFQTTQVLLGLANLLRSYTQSLPVTKADYVRLLKQYTQMHYRQKQNGILNLQEDYYPDDNRGDIVGLARSHHYFHSGYIDLVLGGLVGIRPRADDVLEINPLLADSTSIPYFKVQDAPWHGHNIGVTWDSDGSRYGEGKGLRVTVDGQVVASSETLGRLTANVSRKAVVGIARPIAKSIQLVRGQFPKGSVSSGTDAERIHDAIDGRVDFFAEGPNGWEPAQTSTDSQQWYTIDFGSATGLSRCELAFYQDASTYAIPRDYTIFKPNGSGGWTKVVGFGEQLIGNGIVNVNWTTFSASQLRVQFTQPANKKVRLVEFKVY